MIRLTQFERFEFCDGYDEKSMSRSNVRKFSLRLGVGRRRFDDDHRAHHFLRLAMIVVGISLLGMLAVSSTWAQEDSAPLVKEAEVGYTERVMAAGDGAHLWFLRVRQSSDGVRYRVAHHLDEMGPGAAIDAMVLPVRPEAMEAVGGSLYCIYAPVHVGSGPKTRQVARATVVQDSHGRWNYDSPSRSGRIITPLPGFGEILGITNDGRQPLVLMRFPKGRETTDSSGRKSTNHSAESSPNSSGEADLSSKVLSEREPGGEEKTGNPWWSIDESTEGSVLLRLGIGKWERIALPDEVRQYDKGACRLLPGAHPILMSSSIGKGLTSGDVKSPRAKMYILQDDLTWSEPTEIDVNVGSIESAATVSGQTIIATPGSDRSSVVISCVRRGEVVPICTLRDQTPERSLVSIPGAIGMMYLNTADRTVVLRRIDLETGKTIDTTNMNQPIRLDSEDFSPLILVGALLLTIVIVFIVRPDPTAVRISVPEGASLASPRRRLAAAVIDFVPSSILAILILGASPVELLNWPLVTRDIGDAQCVLIAILITVAHSALSEMLTGRTFGKALLASRVLDTSGVRASAKQILVRNALKIVVLVVPPLALFVFINPFRQRLGDLVARTMVVVDRKQSGNTESGGSE